jgi:hypothetical protein
MYGKLQDVQGNYLLLMWKHSEVRCIVFFSCVLGGKSFQTANVLKVYVNHMGKIWYEIILTSNLKQCHLKRLSL